VPDNIAGHPSVKNHSSRTGLKPSEMPLDRSYHHAAMKRLPDSWKRGRPDIVHFALMEALSTPLFLKGMLKVYVHTVNDKVITIADNLRVPKSYFRFEGLMVSLFRDGVIKSDEGAVLMELANGTFSNLVNDIGADKIVGLSTAGVQSNVHKVAGIAKGIDDCAFVIGGFPSGHFSEKVTKNLGPTYSISDFGLEAHVVIARVLYECELLEEGVHHEGNE
jgi:rRNA small subunit pseudouridine methyltransferase Nep1